MAEVARKALGEVLNTSGIVPPSPNKGTQYTKLTQLEHVLVCMCAVFLSSALFVYFLHFFAFFLHFLQRSYPILPSLPHPPSRTPPP